VEDFFSTEEGGRLGDRLGRTSNRYRAAAMGDMSPGRVVINAQRSGSSASEVVTTIAATALIAASWWYYSAPFTVLLVTAGIIIICFSIPWPLPLSLAFVSLSMFRIHEAYPILFPYKLPLVTAGLLVVSVVLLWGRVRASWPIELRLFLFFFAVASLSGVFAVNPGASFLFWTGTFWKVGAVTLILAWLPKTAEDLELAARAMVISGGAVAVVAIRNKALGLDLVEVTRVTVGRELDSSLGDPNDLAFILLVPLGLAAALVAFRCGVVNRLIGLISAPLIFTAILFTQSRGAIVGLACMFGALSLRYVRSKAILIIAGVVAAAILYVAMGIDERVSGGAAEEGVGESAVGRIDAWRAALVSAVRHPVLGIGINNFELFSVRLLGRVRAVHSTWLAVLAETGPFGLLTFGGMLCTAALGAWRSFLCLEIHQGAGRAVAFGLVLGFAGLIGAGSFLSQAFNWPFYVVVALAIATSRYTAEFQNTTSNRAA
jgi:putative inorganic carbon (HCO3(-)) transporter